MNASIASLVALLATVGIGLYTRVNMGILGIAFAFLTGYFINGMNPVDIYVEGFPLGLFFLLLGTTLFSSAARQNGTYEVLAKPLTFLSKGNRRLACFIVFACCFVLSSLGMGTIVASAVLLPLMIEYSKEEELPEFLVILLAISGSLAGGLSTIAPTGVLAKQLAGDAGITNYWAVFVMAAVIFSLHGLAFFLFFGGMKLDRLPEREYSPMILNGAQFFTIIVAFGVLTAILGFKLDLGLSAFMGAAILLLFGAADQDTTVSGVAWGTLLLLCGVGVLFYVISASGGIIFLENFLIERIGPRTATASIAFLAGAMSLVSSSTAVVMPTLIPILPEMARGAGYTANIAGLLAAVMIGTHTVAYSPISTMGALGLSSSAADENGRQGLFTKLLLVALVMWALTSLILLTGIFALPFENGGVAL